LSVLFDLQGAQSPVHADRGIGRYLTELTDALERLRPDGVSAFLLNPDFPVPESLEDLVARGRVARSDEARDGEGSVFHIGSPFERVSLDRLWPAWAHAAGMRLTLTLYDLIPAIHPEIYFADSGMRRWYCGRLQLIRRADRILAISETTGRDAVRILGVRPEQVVVVGAAVSNQFQPTERPEEAFAAAEGAVPGLEPDFILYTGGIDPRKNLDRLLAAYAALPLEVRAGHELVVVCQVGQTEREALDRQLRELGIADRVRFPGYVAEDALIRLYQACTLFVFPSLYEGFGFPIAEAMACGAPVIASRTSALTELVDDRDAQFDPFDVASIGGTMERFLTDEQLREGLTRCPLDSRFTWPSVAERTVAAYDDLRRLPRRARPRLREQ
jgi:glycosyltransferase involved in cell wall biosynthesis